MEEWLDEVDAEGNPTGKRVERRRVHAEGIRHRTSHVWILRRREGRLQVLVQKRSEEKDSYPGCYDISSAGHIPAGCGFEESAVRELQEELGISVPAKALEVCGMYGNFWRGSFYGKPFLDHEVIRVYRLFMDVEPEDLTLQTEEVACTQWFDYDELLEKLREGSIPNCIVEEEYLMLVREGEKTR